MSHTSQQLSREEFLREIESLTWYHTIDLGKGIVTPGIYDHRPYLPYYGIPDDLTGKTALDIGAGSGFFAFEMERRGAKVTAIDLPAWFDHDFGPRYQPDQTAEQGLRYLREPLALAKAALNSQVEKIEMTIYDVSPETVGTYDLVFCGSLLLHLTDPIQALWRIRGVTRELAIIATVIHPMPNPEPLALFVGHYRGDAWWMPNQACFEEMVESAGFVNGQMYSEFRLDYRDKKRGTHHGVLHAWNTTQQSFVIPQLDPRAIEQSQARVNPPDETFRRRGRGALAYMRGQFAKLKGWLTRR